MAGRTMPDPIFANRKLVAIYDAFDGSREDLLPYLNLAQSIGARKVLDLGCGTGCLAILLAQHGFEVTGVDPARASLNFARAKPGANLVRWTEGTAAMLPALQADLAVMTGNVAQVFLTD